MLCYVRYIVGLFFFFFFKQKTAYEMRISDWSSDVCSSDLLPAVATALQNSAATTVKELLADLDLAQGIGTWAAGGIEALRELRQPLGEVELAFKTLAETTTEGIERARTLGLSVEIGRAHV